MRFKGFTATMAILGSEREVSFEGDKLTISGVTSDDVMAMVTMLRGSSAVGSDGGTPEKAEPAKPASTNVEPGPAPAPTRGRGRRSVATPPAEQPVAVAPTPPSSPVVKTAGVSAAADEPAKPSPEGPESWVEGDAPAAADKQESSRATTEEEDKIPFGDDEGEAEEGEEEDSEPPAEVKKEERAGTIPEELPANIVNAARLRDVLEWLESFGFTTKDQLVAACESLREKVALIKRIDNLNDRVVRTLQVIHGS